MALKYLVFTILISFKIPLKAQNPPAEFKRLQTKILF